MKSILMPRAPKSRPPPQRVHYQSPLRKQTRTSPLIISRKLLLGKLATPTRRAAKPSQRCPQNRGPQRRRTFWCATASVQDSKRPDGRHLGEPVYSSRPPPDFS